MVAELAGSGGFAAVGTYGSAGAKLEMHPQTAQMLEEWLTMLAERGEKETFAYIKKINKEVRKNK